VSGASSLATRPSRPVRDRDGRSGRECCGGIAPGGARAD
jgi:hypothetical protein